MKIIGRYLIKNYKGKYQLRADIDQRTGTYCRDKDGNLENYIDVWISCYHNCKIFHYGYGVLEFYCPSIGRGHNIVKAIYEGILGSVDKFENIEHKTREDGTTYESKFFDYDLMYKELESDGIIFDITDTDEEVFFKFKSTNMEKLVQYFKPKTSAANRSPFSVKNLPKEKYAIPMEDLEVYKEITALIPKGDIRTYVNMNNTFVDSIATKKHKAEDIRNDISRSRLKQNEWFHKEGLWNKYIKHIKTYLEKEKIL